VVAWLKMRRAQGLARMHGRAALSTVGPAPGPAMGSRLHAAWAEEDAPHWGSVVLARARGLGTLPAWERYGIALRNGRRRLRLSCLVPAACPLARQDRGG